MVDLQIHTNEQERSKKRKKKCDRKHPRPKKEARKMKSKKTLRHDYFSSTTIGLGSLQLLGTTTDAEIMKRRGLTRWILTRRLPTNQTRRYRRLGKRVGNAASPWKRHRPSFQPRVTEPAHFLARLWPLPPFHFVAEASRRD